MGWLTPARIPSMPSPLLSLKAACSHRVKRQLNANSSAHSPVRPLLQCFPIEIRELRSTSPSRLGPAVTLGVQRSRVCHALGAVWVPYSTCDLKADCRRHPSAGDVFSLGCLSLFFVS